MASAFVSVAAAATTAPLNPAYRDEEFEFYLSDLNAKALIVDADGDSPATAVAERLGVGVLRLTTRSTEAAGLFDLRGEAVDEPSGDADAAAEDIALVLHTSGTTSRPRSYRSATPTHAHPPRTSRRRCPWIRRNRCLNVMPLFHIHGLMAAVLASLSAGASSTVRLGSMLLDFSPGSTRSVRLGTRRAPPCTKQSWHAPSAIERSLGGPGYASFARPARRCRRRSWRSWKRSSVFPLSSPTV